MAFFVENENRNWATLHVNVIRLLFLFWVLISKTFKHSTVLESPNKWASLENNPKQIIRWGLGGMGGCHDNQECVLGTSWWKHTTKQTKRPNRRNINDQTDKTAKQTKHKRPNRRNKRPNSSHAQREKLFMWHQQQQKFTKYYNAFPHLFCQ